MRRGPARRGARRTARRTTRRTARRVMRRRRRRRIMVGGMVLLAAGGTAAAIKLTQKDAQKIEQHTGQPVEELGDEELQTAMNDLGIQSQALTPEDQAALAAQPPDEGEYEDEPEGDYLDELERLAELKEKGIITEEEFDAKKKQLLGL